MATVHVTGVCHVIKWNWISLSWHLHIPEQELCLCVEHLRLCVLQLMLREPVVPCCFDLSVFVPTNYCTMQQSLHRVMSILPYSVVSSSTGHPCYPKNVQVIGSRTCQITRSGICMWTWLDWLQVFQWTFNKTAFLRSHLYVQNRLVKPMWIALHTIIMLYCVDCFCAACWDLIHYLNGYLSHPKSVTWYSIPKKNSTQHNTTSPL